MNKWAITLKKAQPWEGIKTRMKAFPEALVWHSWHQRDSLTAGHGSGARHVGVRELGRWWRQWSSSAQEVFLWGMLLHPYLPALQFLMAWQAGASHECKPWHLQDLIFRGGTIGMDFFFQKYFWFNTMSLSNTIVLSSVFSYSFWVSDFKALLLPLKHTQIALKIEQRFPAQLIKAHKFVFTALMQ